MIVTLTTDWGGRDFFGAMVKGRLHSLVPGVQIVDLSHEQRQGEWGSLRDIIRQGCFSFPEGTVHLIDVGDEMKMSSGDAPGGDKSYRPSPVAIRYRGQYLICSEQRPLRWSLDRVPDVAVALKLPDAVVSFSFLALDIYCEVVRGIAEGRELEEFGEVIEQFTPISSSAVNYDGSGFDAKVMYVDHYGNAHLDAMYNDFERMRGGRRFVLEITSRPGLTQRGDSIRTVSRHFNDAMVGTLILMVSRSGHLMLSVNGGSAAQLFGLQPGISCHVAFNS